MPATIAAREDDRIGRGLVVRAAKRKEKERSLVLTATLTAEEGKEDEVRALCRGIVEHFRPMVSYYLVLLLWVSWFSVCLLFGTVLLM